MTLKLLPGKMSSGCSALYLACLLGLIACTDQTTDQTAEEAGEVAVEEAAPAPISDEEIAKNNRGVALMGRFDYARAGDVFARLIEARPQWHEVRINYAIALKNRQGEGDAERALEQLAMVLADEPDNARANYVSGVLQLYLGEVDAASGYFQATLTADPDDAYAHYYLGQCQLRSGDSQAALGSYQQAIALDPYLRSAYYSAAQVLRRLGRSEEASEQLALFQRFADNPAARLAEFKYTRMGPKSIATVVGEPVAADIAANPPEGALFAEQRIVAALDDAPGNLRVSTVDLDGNGAQDLFLSGAEGASNRVLRSDPAGNFLEQREHPWRDTSDINAIAWGDFDNDQLVDAYLCRSGPNQLWRQQEAGDWQQVPASAGADDGDKDCADAAMVDADHDGDLDILIANRGAGDELLNNNRDGTFRSLADKLGSAAESADTRFILTADLDADNDVDLIFVREQAPHQVLINDRMWNYTRADGFSEFVDSDVVALASTDTDADGQSELLSLDGQGVIRHWQPAEQASRSAWQSREIYQSALAAEQSVDLAAVDFDGDGRAEMTLLAEGAFEVVALPAELRSQARADLLLAERFEGGTPTPITRSVRGSSLFAMNASGGLMEWAPGPGRFKFATFRLSGKHDAAETMRSNASGIGTQVAVRNGASWAMADTHKNSSVRGYGLQPLAVGLAGQEQADFVEVEWSDGVYQTELEVAGGEVTRIAEEQRQLGSCPVLFAWSGEQYEFVTDILGVGAQGFLIEPGVLLPPRPWEKISFAPGSIAAQDGRMKFKLTEPMEENAYVDAMSLDVYDIPEGWQLVIDERMGTAAPDVTGDALFYRTEVMPVAASDSAGNDVLASVSEHDQVAMQPGDIDRRFIGLLKEPESITIEFDTPIDKLADRPDAQPVLVSESWLELPYSQTHFSAWQAGLEFRPVSLAARDAEGEWHDVYPDFGIPAGMPRVLALPLLDLPTNTMALRLSWNREIYWDRFRVVYAEQPPAEMQHTRLTPDLAKVAKSGFSRRITHSQRRPEYDYQQRRPFGDVKYATGFYTALGEMTELVSNPDDALAIIGPGEEVHVEFVEPQAPAQGTQRWYVLDTRGWGKDKDMYTQLGNTVGPLPRAYPDADEQQREELHQRHNTRFQSGR